MKNYEIATATINSFDCLAKLLRSFEKVSRKRKGGKRAILVFTNTVGPTDYCFESELWIQNLD